MRAFLKRWLTSTGALGLALMLLAACDPPLDPIFHAKFHSFERDGVVYETRSQFDPFERGWFIRALSIQQPLTVADRDFTLQLVSDQLGPLLCSGNAMKVLSGTSWNKFAGYRTSYLEDPGVFQLVGRCTSAPPSGEPLMRRPPVSVAYPAYPAFTVR